MQAVGRATDDGRLFLLTSGTEDIFSWKERMPGIFGAIGVPRDQRALLATAFGIAGPGCESIERDDVILGGHAHYPNNCLIESTGLVALLDGEASLYASAGRSGIRHLYDRDSRGIAVRAACTGNIALWNAGDRQLDIGTEWTTTFPLYFTAIPGGGFLFSSRLRALARVLRPIPDALGIGQFLHAAFFLTDRTQWSGIRRLQPGQALRFNAATDQLTTIERSQLWVGQIESGASSAQLAEDGWERVGLAVKDSSLADRELTIMSSGGWDSRTVLARTVSCVPRERLLGYSHGDALSREIHLAQRLVGSTGIAFHHEPIDSRCFEQDAIHDGFAREEHVMFPHWLRAGRLAAQMGNRVITSGLYGEIMGGHYGRGMLLTGAKQMHVVLASLFGSRAPAEPANAADVASIIDFLSVPTVVRPWVINEDWWHSVAPDLEAWRAEVTADILRLQSRGVQTVNQLVEGYVAEHRGSQYGNAQLRAARASVDVALPLADRRVLEWTTRLPLNAKIHNRANRLMLAQHYPQLLRYPMAATLADARRSLVVQEASRFARKGFEFGRRRLHALTGTGTPVPRLSWVNFDFLRGGAELTEVVSDLRGDMWDRGAILQHVRDSATNLTVSSHSTFDHLLKVYTLDLGMHGV